MKLRVIHLSSGLGQGGAETVLTRLITHSSQENIVISFSDDGVYGEILRKAGITVYALGMKSSRIGFKDFWKLFKLLKSLKGDVVQTWMYHADLFGGIVARLAGYRHIAWGIRNSGDSLKQTAKFNYYLARISALFSYFIPQRIIVCGELAAQRHAEWGYSRSKMMVIQNGYDLSRWQYNEQAALRLRQEWQVGDVPVLGFVARWNPLKDHASLVQAFAMVKEQVPNAVLVLVGKDMDSQNTTLMALLSKYSLTLNQDVLLLGQRQDIPEIMSALDIHVLSSIAEGFPNVVSEAMACHCLNVVTDVGDAALIVEEYGWVAQAANVQDLFNKMLNAISFLEKSVAMSEQKQELIQFLTQARQRVIERFSLENMVSKYETTWLAMKENKDI